MYLFSRQFRFFCIPQGISFCSPPHTQVMAESTMHQVTLARGSICVKLCAKTLLLECSNCSLSAFVLAQGTAASCHVCYYRAKTGFPPLLQFTRQLLPLLPAAEWAWAVAFTQCACFYMLTQTCLWHVMLLCLLGGGQTDKISPVSQEASFPELKTPNQSAKTVLLYTKFDMMFEGGRLSSHMGKLWQSSGFFTPKDWMWEKAQL